MTPAIRYRYQSIVQELSFETSRSSGAGGQHVNKTESRVSAVFDLLNSNCFSEKEKDILGVNLKSRLRSGILRVSSQQSRSQHRNKQHAIELLLQLLGEGLKTKVVRKKSTMSRAQKERRYQSKKKRSETKQLRKKIRPEDY